MISHILAPKKYNFQKLSRTEFASVWKISNKVETNWESAINTHMVDNMAKNMWLPYGSLVAIFLEHVKFYLEGEEADQEYIGI